MKRALSERDICTQYITPAVVKASWDLRTQVREEVSFTKRRIIVRGKLVTRAPPRRADYKQLTQSNLRTTLAPIPPLTEQHRIAAKVKALLALCDQLESQLTTTQTESRRLLEAVLHHALMNSGTAGQMPLNAGKAV